MRGLKKILDKHSKWLTDSSQGSQANLSKADLSGANLSGVNLTLANLCGANLSRANLYRADLHKANLSGAYLTGAYLTGANLCGANLSRANLIRANLIRANLYKANLSGAYLTGANLCGANLSGADLSKIKSFHSIVPEEGEFIAFKKLKSGAIAKLLIPKDAKRIGGLISRKCRVSKAKVLEISNGVYKDFDKYKGKLLYKVGKTVKPDSFDDDVTKECTNGIHCFITKKEAEDYE